MKNIRAWGHSLCNTLENTPLSLTLWVVAFFCLIVFRLGIDLGLEDLPRLSFFQLFFQWVHLLLFFLFSYLLLLPLIKTAGNTTYGKAARVLLFGFLIILFPPFIDKMIFGDSLYWSFYIFDSLSGLALRFFTFFGDNPHLGITYGVRVEVALVTIAIFCYGLIKTGRIARSFFYAFLGYALLFFLGTLPSWISFLFLSHSFPLTEISSTHIAEFFLSPETILGREVQDLRSALGYKMSLFLLPLTFIGTLWLWYRTRKEECLAFFGNVRWPQIFYHNGLMVVGMLLAVIYTEATLPLGIFHFLAFILLALSVTAAWLTSVLINDIYDTKIDALTNTHRPLITGLIAKDQYQSYAAILLLFSLVGAAVVSFQAAVLLVFYQALATLYSVPPFRLKRFLGLATAVASATGIAVLFLGYITIAPNHTLLGLPSSLIVYLGLVYALIIPLKDFKDIKGDRDDKVYTLPVVFGEQRAKVIMSTITFLIFVSSIFVLHAPEILLWALLFGSLSFWLIQQAGIKGSRITYPRLSAIFMLLALGYGLGLVIFLF